jgi:hypothetical protein
MSCLTFPLRGLPFGCLHQRRRRFIHIETPQVSVRPRPAHATVAARKAGARSAHAAVARQPPTHYIQPMPDDLYDRDVLAWSEHQAALLRRIARGERVNDVDWDHVVEEIEDVGLSELNAVHSFLRQMLAHLLKLRGWPKNRASNHWRDEIATFQVEAIARFALSMRQRIDLDKTYALAQRQIARQRAGADRGVPAPPACPVTIDDLLNLSVAELEAAFIAAV